MTGSIYLETVRQNVRAALYWGIGFGLTAVLIVWMVPIFDMNQMAEAMEKFSPVILAMIGVRPEDAAFMARSEGFIAMGFFGRMVIMFIVYPLVMGFRVTTNEEEEGIMDTVLSLPVPRWRLVLEKFCAYVTLNALVAALIFVGFVVGQQLIDIDLEMGWIANSVINLMPTMIFVLALTIFIGALISRRKYVIVIALGIVIYSYSFDVVGNMGAGSILENIRVVSFFKYFDSTGVMQNGLSATNVIGLLVVAAVLLAASLWAFERRDIGL